MSEPLREEIQEIAPAPERETSAPGMAWHGFLTRFLLYLLPVCAVFQALWIETGRIYYTAEIQEKIYAGIVGMRALDRGLCLLLLGAAALFICAQRKLKRLRRSGAALLLAGLGLAALGWALYGAVRWGISGLPPLSISLMGQCAFYIALLLVNAQYYARRKDRLNVENAGERS